MSVDLVDYKTRWGVHNYLFFQVGEVEACGGVQKVEYWQSVGGLMEFDTWMELSTFSEQ